jgi:type IV secretory pathway VirB4 component
MEMVDGYGDSGNPVIEKSQFILSLFAQLTGGNLKPQAKSIIDRCVAGTFADYQNGGQTPTLIALREKLLSQPEPEAHELALSLELFTSCTLDIFARKTNVDTTNRLVCYDIMDLGESLKTMGLLVVTDSMINRVVENWRSNKRTHLMIDEFHVLFSDDYSAEFFASAWRRFRKRNAVPTAITQNVDYLLQNETATSMLSNSEFVIMLNQASSDRDRLAHHLHISPEQMSYITNADAGSGLIRYGSSLVPFVNKFPRQTKLYRLMTTKPGDLTATQ